MTNNDHKSLYSNGALSCFFGSRIQKNHFGQKLKKNQYQVGVPDMPSFCTGFASHFRPDQSRSARYFDSSSGKFGSSSAEVPSPSLEWSINLFDTCYIILRPFMGSFPELYCLTSSRLSHSLAIRFKSTTHLTYFI